MIQTLTPNPIQIKIIQVFQQMTEQLFAINTIICHEVRYDTLMMKSEQLFAIKSRIRYIILMLKSLRRIMLKLAAEEDKTKERQKINTKNRDSKRRYAAN